jgi:hypothetical protein
MIHKNNTQKNTQKGCLIKFPLTYANIVTILIVISSL